MTYIVVSHKVGRPGDVYIPAEGVNVAALLDGGFIVESTKTVTKSAKPKSSKTAGSTTEATQSDEE